MIGCMYVFTEKMTLASNRFTIYSERCPKCIHYRYTEVCSFITLALEYTPGL